MSAKLLTLAVADLGDIPGLLRNIADDIESGEYGEVLEGALVLSSEDLDVFALGRRQDGYLTHYLLARAQRKLERVDLL